MRTCAYYADRSKYDYRMMIIYIYIGNQCYVALYHDIKRVIYTTEGELSSSFEEFLAV